MKSRVYRWVPVFKWQQFLRLEGVEALMVAIELRHSRRAELRRRRKRHPSQKRVFIKFPPGQSETRRPVGTETEGQGRN